MLNNMHIYIMAPSMTKRYLPFEEFSTQSKRTGKSWWVLSQVPLHPPFSSLTCQWSLTIRTDNKKVADFKGIMCIWQCSMDIPSPGTESGTIFRSRLSLQSSFRQCVHEFLLSKKNDHQVFDKMPQWNALMKAGEREREGENTCCCLTRSLRRDNKQLLLLSDVIAIRRWISY